MRIYGLQGLHMEACAIIRARRVSEGCPYPSLTRRALTFLDGWHFIVSSITMHGMTTLIVEPEEITIPSWVQDLISFRRWTESEDFPEQGRICFLKGEVWIDMSKEQLFSHVQVKNEYAFTLTGVAKADDVGIFFPDGLFLTHPAVNISVKPDGTFLFHETLESGRARLIEGVDGGYVELEGTPDMVLEIVSRGSVHKDTVILKEAYWQAGIAEYWLVDARGETPRFDIFRHGPKGYQAVRKHDGWVKSKVFGRSFKLERKNGRRGYPEFTLRVA